MYNLKPTNMLGMRPKKNYQKTYPERMTIANGLVCGGKWPSVCFKPMAMVASFLGLAVDVASTAKVLEFSLIRSLDTF